MRDKRGGELGTGIRILGVLITKKPLSKKQESVGSPGKRAH